MPKDHATANFYNNLVAGCIRRGSLGIQKRFNPDSFATLYSVSKYLQPFLSSRISTSHSVLDFGCGSGNLLPLLSPLCASVCGTDISSSFLELSRQTIQRHNLTNAYVCESSHLTQSSFDTIIVFDVLHHVEDIPAVIRRLKLLLRPGGQLIVFEPYIINPVLFLFHLVDPNEHGVFRLGTIRRMSRYISASGFRVLDSAGFGIVIGPSNPFSNFLVDILSSFSRILGFLSPKYFIVATHD